MGFLVNKSYIYIQCYSLKLTVCLREMNAEWVLNVFPSSLNINKTNFWSFLIFFWKPVLFYVHVYFQAVFFLPAFSAAVLDTNRDQRVKNWSSKTPQGRFNSRLTINLIVKVFFVNILVYNMSDDQSETQIH